MVMGEDVGHYGGSYKVRRVAGGKQPLFATHTPTGLHRR